MTSTRIAELRKLYEDRLWVSLPPQICFSFMRIHDSYRGKLLAYGFQWGDPSENGLVWSYFVNLSELGALGTDDLVREVAERDAAQMMADVTAMANKNWCQGEQI